MKRIVFLLLGLVLTHSNAEAQVNALCPSSYPAAVEVYKNIQPTQYDFTRNTLDLRYLGKGAYSPYGYHRKTHLRGLTVGRQSISFDVKTRRQSTAGGYCLSLSQIRLYMNYAPTVYVANEFPQGSPIFNRVLEHERVHVDISSALLERYLPVLRQRFFNTAFAQQSFGPYPSHMIGVREQQLKQEMKSFVAQFQAEMFSEGERQHNRFDDGTRQDRIHYNQGVARELERIFKLD